MITIPKDDTPSKLPSITALIEANIPRTEKDKDGVVVWAYNVAKEFVV